MKKRDIIYGCWTVGGLAIIIIFLMIISRYIHWQVLYVLSMGITFIFLNVMAVIYYSRKK